MRQIDTSIHPLDRGNPTYAIDSMQLTEPGNT